jgi:hypothetical protein
MIVTKYLTVLSGKYPANLYRIPDSAGCLNFTGYRIPVSGSGTLGADYMESFQPGLKLSPVKRAEIA